MSVVCRGQPIYVGCPKFFLSILYLLKVNGSIVPMKV